MCELNMVSVFKILLLNLVPNFLFYCHFWSIIGTYFWGFESLISLYKDPMCLRTLCGHSAINHHACQPSCHFATFKHFWLVYQDLAWFWRLRTTPNDKFVYISSLIYDFWVCWCIWMSIFKILKTLWCISAHNFFQCNLTNDKWKDIFIWNFLL